VFARWHPADSSIKAVGGRGLVVRCIDPNSCSACRAERFDDKRKKLSSDPLAPMIFIDRETYDLSRHRIPRTVPHHAGVDQAPPIFQSRELRRSRFIGVRVPPQLLQRSFRIFDSSHLSLSLGHVAVAR